MGPGQWVPASGPGYRSVGPVDKGGPTATVHGDRFYEWFTGDTWVCVGFKGDGVHEKVWLGHGQ
jgi:hypothetical protein